MTDELEEYGTITCQLGASAFSNISYNPKWEVEIELSDLEGMSRDEIWTYLVDEFVQQFIQEDIEMYVPNLDEIVAAVEALQKG